MSLVKQFLLDRPVFNISKLEDILEIPRGSIRPKSDNPISPEYEERLEWYLERYGYRKDGKWRNG